MASPASSASASASAAALQQQYVAASLQHPSNPPPPPLTFQQGPTAHAAQQLALQPLLAQVHAGDVLAYREKRGLPTAKPSARDAQAMQQARATRPQERGEGSLQAAAVAGGGTLTGVATTPGAASATSPRAGNPSGVLAMPLVGEKLAAIVREVDPNFRLAPEAEEALLALADGFVERVVQQSCKVAEHREGREQPAGPRVMGAGAAVTAADVSLVLRSQWGIVVPGAAGAPPAGAREAGKAGREEARKIFQRGGIWETGTGDDARKRAKKER
ncbi:hypothetical protein TeGR_g7499 [Tetraparma gracilis]|uniref:Transcription initiation factor TFIID subunit 12 domain-containing protein n=1 Tax=Tetraparma gracilis TaxID=2962635 RepID=A0ABQ6MFR2_9STRA|nr:hypothetical protein TeGR_g7499 [Tetraparma gracilis]